MLRQLKGHQRPVHVARFAPDKVHVLSGGDDVTLRLWDISSGAQVLRLVGHQDYVRAAEVSPASGDVWASGARAAALLAPLRGCDCLASRLAETVCVRASSC